MGVRREACWWRVMVRPLGEVGAPQRVWSCPTEAGADRVVREVQGRLGAGWRVWKELT